jgi:hypothetical protein
MKLATMLFGRLYATIKYTVFLALLSVCIPFSALQGKSDEQGIPLIKHFKKGNSSLPTNVVYRVTSDRYGYLWLATNEGILIFNGQEFQKVKTPSTDIEFISAVRIDSMWFCFAYSGEVVAINLNTRHISQLKHQGEETYKISNPKVNAFTIPGSTKIVIMDTHMGYFELLTNSDGIYTAYQVFQNDSLRYKDLYHGIKTYPEDVADSMLQNAFRASRGFYRISNEFFNFGNVLYTYRQAEHNQDQQVRKLIDFRDQPNYSDFLVDFAETKNGVLAGFHKDKGLVLYSKNKEITDPDDCFTLLEKTSVSDIERVSDEMIWVSSLDAGIFLIDYSATKPKAVNETVENFNYITLIKQVSDTLFIGTKEGNLITYSKGSKSEIHLGNPFTFNEIFGIFNVSDNHYIIVSKEYLSLFDGKRLVWSKKILFVKDCVEDSHNIYICHKNEYSVINKQNLVTTRHKFENEGIISVTKSPNGQLYFGGVTGLFKHDQKIDLGEEIRIYKVRTFGRYVVVGTNRGIFVISPEQTIIKLKRNMSIAGNLAKKLFPTSSNDMYVLTENGLFHTDTTWNFSPIMTFDKTKPVSSIYGITTGESSLLISTNSGLYAVPKKRAPSEKSTKKVFRRITLNDNYSISPLQQSYDTDFNKNNTFTFDLESVDFSSPNFPVVWILKKNNGKLILSDTLTLSESFRLPVIEPGRYIIEAAVLSDAQADTAPNLFYLSIQPKIWQQIWFKTISGMIIILLTIVLSVTAYRFYHRRYLNKIILQNKMNQLRNKVQVSRLKPHFIFNSFNPIQSHILNNNTLQALEYIENFSNLLRNSIKLFAKDFISIQEEIKFIDEYLLIEKTKNEGKLNFSCKISSDIDVNNTFIPTMMVQPFFENSLKYARRPGTVLEVNVSVSISEDKKSLVVIVADNGPGYPVDFASKTNHALGITEKRLELLRMEYAVGKITYSNSNGAVSTIELPYLKKKPKQLD